MFSVHEVERCFTLAQSIVVCVYSKTAGTLKSHYFNLPHEIISQQRASRETLLRSHILSSLRLITFKVEVGCINHFGTVLCRCILLTSCVLLYSGKTKMFIPCNFFCLSNIFQPCSSAQQKRKYYLFLRKSLICFYTKNSVFFQYILFTCYCDPQDKLCFA